MKAVKGNIQLTLDNDADAKAMAGQGYDIYQDDGELVMYAAGKKISMDEHEQLVEQAVEQAVAAALESATPEDAKELKKELTAAKKAQETAELALEAMEKRATDAETALADTKTQLDEANAKLALV